MKKAMNLDGMIDKQVCVKLIKLDNIKKESQRFNPLLPSQCLNVPSSSSSSSS